MAAAGVFTLSDDTFKTEVLESDVPVLVDFWATWCGPCQRVAPIIDELAGENEGKAKLAKVDVDDCPQTATDYDVMSIPTLILFKGGQEVDRVMGAVPKSQLQKMIDDNL